MSLTRKGEKSENDVVVRQFGAVELETQQRRLAHDGQEYPRRGADEIPALKEYLHAFADQQGRDGKVVTPQAKSRNADGDGHQHRKQHANEHANPRRQLIGEKQIARAVGTDSEKRGMAQ